MMCFLSDFFTFFDKCNLTRLQNMNSMSCEAMLHGCFAMLKLSFTYDLLSVMDAIPFRVDTISSSDHHYYIGPDICHN